MKSIEILSTIFSTLFDLGHILTPLATEHYKKRLGNGQAKTYRIYYVFGIRIANISTVKHN